jgi:hypothetical protein
MTFELAHLDRRRFLRGTAAALALPRLESLGRLADARAPIRRLACIYFPDGVPMPLKEDPAHEDWSWFPHGAGREFRFTKVLDVLEPLREELTVVSGTSHPAVRAVHGHSNADQFLTGADTGATGDYHNAISLDQVFAGHLGAATRHASMVLSTDGGTGTPRGAHTLSFDRSGRAIPAEHRPRRVFESLFVDRDVDTARRLRLNQSALDDLLEDARGLRGELSAQDRRALDEYLDAVRETERTMARARRWEDIPLPDVSGHGLELDVDVEAPRAYLRTMLDLIHLGFRTDSTRVATYQIGRENGIGHSDHLSKAVDFPLAHALSHETTNPGGWERFGIYCRFLAEEVGRFAAKLKATPEPGGEGNMLDHTLILFGSASSAFHLSRNYPLVLLGGRSMGFRHGQYLNYVGDDAFGGAWNGGTEPWQREFERDDVPLAKLFVTMLQRLGVETDSFAGQTGGIDAV